MTANLHPSDRAGMRRYRRAHLQASRFPADPAPHFEWQAQLVNLGYHLGKPSFPDVRFLAQSVAAAGRDPAEVTHMQMLSIPTVRMYMDTETHALSADDDILVAVRRLLDEGVTGAPVVDDQGHVVGNLSEYDCLRLLAEGRGGDMPRGRVRDFMATTFTAVPPTMDVYYVAGMFLTDPANRRFMVMEGQRLVGVVTRKDILRAVQAGLKDG